MMMCARLFMVGTVLFLVDTEGDEIIKLIIDNSNIVISAISGVFLFNFISFKSSQVNDSWSGNVMMNNKAVFIGNNSRDIRVSELRYKSSVHEAGHLLMFASGEASQLLLNSKIYWKDDFYHGYVKHCFELYSYDSLSNAKLYCLINLAGLMSERHIFGESGLGGGKDLQEFRRFAKVYLAHEESCFCYLGDVTEDEGKENTRLISKFKDKLNNEILEFYKKNNDVLVELSRELENKKEILLKDISPYLNRVVWPDE